MEHAAKQHASAGRARLGEPGGWGAQHSNVGGLGMKCKSCNITTKLTGVIIFLDHKRQNN